MKIILRNLTRGLLWNSVATSAEYSPFKTQERKKKRKKKDIGDIHKSGKVKGRKLSAKAKVISMKILVVLNFPMDRGAWWATGHRVTKSRTQLKQQAGIPQFENPGENATTH